MTTELRATRQLALFRAGAALRWRTPLWTSTVVSAIRGRPRVEEVELTDLETGETRRGRVRHRRVHGRLDPGPRAGGHGRPRHGPRHPRPAVDTALRTSRESVFAAGNLLQGAEPADVAALSGRHAATTAAEHVARKRVAGTARPDRVRAAASLDQPQRREQPRLRSAQTLLRPPLERVRLGPRIEVAQDGRTLWDGRIRRLLPGAPRGCPRGGRQGGPGRRARARAARPSRVRAAHGARGAGRPHGRGRRQARAALGPARRANRRRSGTTGSGKEQDVSVPGAQPERTTR
jgi:hypothetical protein